MSPDPPPRTDEDPPAAELDHFFESGVDLLCIAGANGRFLRLSTAFEAVLGYTRKEMLARPIMEFVHPDDRAASREALATLHQGEEVRQFENRYVCKNGTLRWLSWNCVPHAGLLYASARDVTAAKRTAAALGRAERRYRSMIENAAYGIFLTSLDGRILEANPALVRMLGYDSLAEVRRLDLARDVYVDPAARQEIISHNLKSDEIAPWEVEWKRADGKIIRVRLSGRTVRDELGRLEGFEGVAEDVTGQRLIEERIRQSQKLEAVGQLASGVAHDFNNLITAIRGYAELLLENAGPQGDLSADVTEILDAADRASAVTRQLLAFGRRQILAPQLLDLNAVVRELEHLLRRLIQEDISLVSDLEPELWTVEADPGQIEQVLVNLTVNARNAIESGGTIRIETARRTVPASHPAVPAGEYAVLAVTDDGCGIDPTIRERIFEPFFTTRPGRGGTGLGLSTVYGIVKQSGGEVLVESRIGEGSRFEVLLPRAGPAAAEGQPAQEARPELSGGSETVLVVEDEEMVRSLVGRVLSQQGYEVILAVDGVDALRRFDELEGESLDLLLTDVVMPQMGGRKLADALRAQQPGLRVLFMSGYTDRTDLAFELLESGAPFLQKPFSLAALTGAVRRMLDDRWEE